jgi:hypothetical protein
LRVLVNEREMGYERVIHVLPEERSGTEDVEGDAVWSVMLLVFGYTKSRANSF